MAITRPVSKSIISTVDWGFPVTDAINALQVAVADMVPTAWVNCTIASGYSTGLFGFPPISVRRIGTMAYVRGLAQAQVALGANALVFTLPVGYRPLNPALMMVPVQIGTPTTMYRIGIDPSTGSCSMSDGMPATALIGCDPLFWQCKL